MTGREKAGGASRGEARKAAPAGFNIVLYEPEIPSNTGNIGRTCVATGSSLHLIEPLGFRLDERLIRRAGMDYWDSLDLHTYVNWQDFCEKNMGAAAYMVTTKARQAYTDVRYGEGSFLVFGKESAGIPEELLARHPETCVRIPMLDGVRSLNLANSVAIVLYEALRQGGFSGMRREGELHRLSWGEGDGSAH